MARTCDWRTGTGDDTRCGRAVKHAAHNWVVDHAKINGAFCPTHEVEIRNALLAMGFKMEAKLVDHKPRQVHIAASGSPFSTAEARAWLLEAGLMANAGGRVSRAHLKMYSDAH